MTAFIYDLGTLLHTEHSTDAITQKKALRELAYSQAVQKYPEVTQPIEKLHISDTKKTGAGIRRMYDQSTEHPPDMHHMHTRAGGQFQTV